MERFQHTSRDGDMHLHAHMVSVNSTGGPDDDCRSLPHTEFVTLLFDSHIAAHEIAWMLRGNWDGCNGVSFISPDEEAVDVAAKLHRANWCRTGDSCPIIDSYPISQEAWEALLEELANYF